VVVHVVPSAKLAVKCEAAGVDAVVAEGAEGGGHLAPEPVASMVLWPAVADAVRIPVIAAGGIADARHLAAAFALGAEGIQVGTRFIASAEAAGSAAYVIVCSRSTRPARRSPVGSDRRSAAFAIA
jgi:enoyl-[acyl-carrier protein] reductase II